MSHKKKKNRRRVSLFAKYMMFFLSVETVSLLIFGLVLGFFITDRWKDEQKQNLYNYTQNVAGVYQEYLQSSTTDEASAKSGVRYTLESISSASKADVFITDVDGNVIFCRHSVKTDGNQSAGSCEHSDMKIPGEITTGILANAMFATTSDMGGLYEKEYFVSASTSQKNPAADADAIVFAVQTIGTGLVAYRAEFSNIYISVAIAFMLITGFIAYVLTYNMIKPLKDMSEATKQYSKGDFSYRIKQKRKNTVREFDELSAAMNAMAESLEQHENSRAEFVANVSHELKTPMTTIGGFIDGVLDGTISADKRDYYLQKVSDEIKRLSRLVVTMLNMSKMEAGELRIKPSQFNLTEQLFGIFIAFEQKINNKNINVKGLERLQNIYIHADPDMLNQVFYNLVDNAVKFTDNGGDIDISMFVEDDYVSVAIRNSGKGIPAEDIDHVFERFYKGDKSRSLDAKSAGLGLFIVKRLVEYHKGEISVISPDCKYTQFTVKLRIRQPDA